MVNGICNRKNKTLTLTKRTVIHKNAEQLLQLHVQSPQMISK